MSVSMIDTYSYTSPARVKALLVPINGCSRRDFENYVGLLKNDGSEIRLLDLTPQPKLTHFNPQTFPQGQIAFEFLTSIPDSSSIFLYDFEPYRKVFIVIGIGKYNEQHKSADHSTGLANSYPGCIVHNTILFETPNCSLPSPSDHTSRLNFFHSGKETNIQTIMCGIGENFLNAIEVYASSYLTITLRSPVSLNTSSYMLPATIARAQKRILSGSVTSISSTLSANGSSNGNGTSSNGNTGSPNYNNYGSNGGSNSISGSGHFSAKTNGGFNMSDKSKLQLRQSGRQAKLMGNFRLLAGKYSDALHYFNEACLLLKKCDDYLWLGSSLEGIGICTILLQYLGVHYQLPTNLLHNILQIPKSKFTPVDEITIPNVSRLSTDSRNSTANTNTSTTKRNSIYSPRNSNSSIVNFQLPAITNVSSSTGASANPNNFDALPIPEFIKYVSSKIFQSYQMSSNDFENMVPDNVYVDSLLRYLKFMVYIYMSGKDANPNSILESIVKSLKIDRKLDHEIKDSTFTKIEIIREMDRIFQFQLIDMNSIQQCKVYCTLASIYDDLGLERKRAFILRVLLASMLPKLKQQLQKDISAKHAQEESVVDEIDNSLGFREILSALFSIYNIETPKWVTLQIPFLKLCLEISETIKDWMNSIKICSLLLSKYVHCLDVEDQLWIKETFDKLVAYSRMNNLPVQNTYWDPFLVRRVKFLNKTKEELVPFKEYIKNGQGSNSSTNPQKPNKPFIFNPYSKESKTAFNKDKVIMADDIYQLTVTLQNPFAFEIEIGDLEIVTAEGSVKVQTLTNLLRPAMTTILPNSITTTNFGNSARRNISTISKPRQLLSKLRNATSSTPAIPTNSLIAPSNNGNAGTTATTSSSSTSSFNNHLNIIGNSIRQFLVSFKPLAVGELKIIGFNVSVSNCKGPFFRIIESEGAARYEKVKLATKKIKSDEMKLEVDSDNQNNTTSDFKTENFNTSSLELMVIKQQPILSLSNILLNNGWLMLLQGEKHRFSIELTNQSTELINYLSFSFWDSTIEPLNHKLSNLTNNTPASEVYEIEWYLLKFKPFEILNKEDITSKYKKILPQTNLTIDYEITGKKGMKALKMILEYSNKEIGDDEAALDRLFVKFVHVPIQLTILPSIEIIGCDVLPLIETSMKSFVSSNGTGPFNKLLKYLETLLLTESASDFSLFVIDLKNSWSKSLQVDINYKIDDKHTFIIDEMLESQKSIRIFLPIKRILCTEYDLTRKIPSLMNKQFIKNYLISEEEELQMRELFWLRYLLLEKLNGTWKSKNSQRIGVIDFRSIRLNSKMVTELVKPKIQMSLSIRRENDDQKVIFEKEGLKYTLQTEEFYLIHTQVSNNTLKDIRGILRLIPIPLDYNVLYPTGHPMKNALASIDRKLLIHGVLQKSVGVIKPGESMESDLSFTILEKGSYEWGVVFEEITSDGGRSQVVGSDPITISA